MKSSAIVCFVFEMEIVGYAEICLKMVCLFSYFFICLVSDGVVIKVSQLDNLPSDDGK